MKPLDCNSSSACCELAGCLGMGPELALELGAGVLAPAEQAQRTTLE
jgi:hypothetical protein